MKKNTKHILTLGLFILILFGLKIQTVNAFEYVPLTTLPGFFTAKTPFQNPADLVSGAYTLAIGIASVLAVLVIMWGGIKYIMSATPYGKGEGKQDLQNAFFGMVVLLGAYILLRTINIDLVKRNVVFPQAPVNNLGGLVALKQKTDFLVAEMKKAREQINSYEKAIKESGVELASTTSALLKLKEEEGKICLNKNSDSCRQKQNEVKFAEAKIQIMKEKISFFKEQSLYTKASSFGTSAHEHLLSTELEKMISVDESNTIVDVDADELEEVFRNMSEKIIVAKNQLEKDDKEIKPTDKKIKDHVNAVKKFLEISSGLFTDMSSAVSTNFFTDNFDDDGVLLKNSKNIDEIIYRYDSRILLDQSLDTESKKLVLDMLKKDRELIVRAFTSNKSVRDACTEPQNKQSIFCK